MYTHGAGQMKEGDFWIRESSMQPQAKLLLIFQTDKEKPRETGKGSPARSAREGGECCTAIREGRLQWTSTPEGAGALC